MAKSDKRTIFLQAEPALFDTINFGAIDTIRSDSEKTVFRKYQAIGGVADQK